MSSCLAALIDEAGDGVDQYARAERVIYLVETSINRRKRGGNKVERQFFKTTVQGVQNFRAKFEEIRASSDHWQTKIKKITELTDNFRAGWREIAEKARLAEQEAQARVEQLQANPPARQTPSASAIAAANYERDMLVSQVVAAGSAGAVRSLLANIDTEAQHRGLLLALPALLDAAAKKFDGDQTALAMTRGTLDVARRKAEEALMPQAERDHLAAVEEAQAAVNAVSADFALALSEAQKAVPALDATGIDSWTEQQIRSDAPPEFGFEQAAVTRAYEKGKADAAKEAAAEGE